MAITLQESITGSDATFQVTGSRVALDVNIGSGVTINIGSVSATVDSVYVISGNVAITEQTPLVDNKNNPAWEFTYSGNGVIVEGIQFIGAGSFVNTFTYSGTGVITNIGSWS